MSYDEFRMRRYNAYPVSAASEPAGASCVPVGAGQAASGGAPCT